MKNEGLPSGGMALEGWLIVLSTLLMLLFLRNYLNVIPHVLDSFSRERGNSDIEGSVRKSRDRNICALILLIPTILVLDHFRIYAPRFMDPLDKDIRLLAVGGAFLGYLLVRMAVRSAAAPKKRRDAYQRAARFSGTFFILLCSVVLTSIGILAAFHVPAGGIRTVILVESIFIYLVFLLRKAQILSGFCNPLSVFLYLCALELLPTGLFIASAAVL